MEEQSDSSEECSPDLPTGSGGKGSEGSESPAVAEQQHVPRVPLESMDQRASRPVSGLASPSPPLLSPTSPTARTLEMFRLNRTDLRGVPDTEEVEGIPDDGVWNISFSDLKIVRELAEGSFGRVYLASYCGTQVAVKLLFQVDTVANIGKYILRELAMLRAVAHPNIMQLLGLARQNQDVFLVTEYMEKGDLMEIVYDLANAPMSWPLRCHLMVQIARPVAYLHQRNIVHRDIKLENVLVDSHWHVKLCDFGFARCMDNQIAMARGVRMRRMTVAGTDQWMAPEVLLLQPYNQSADIFSMGCTFLELICRRQPPYRTKDTNYSFDVQHFLSSVPKNSPKEILMLVLDMCSDACASRPSAEKVIKTLELVQGALPAVDIRERPSRTDSVDASRTSGEGDSLGDRVNNLKGRAAKRGGSSSGGTAEPSTPDSMMRRAKSADSAETMENNSQNNVSPDKTGGAVSLHVRRVSVTRKKLGNVILESPVVVVHNASSPSSRKLHAALTSDGVIFFWKNEARNLPSIQRILLDCASKAERVVSDGSSNGNNTIHVKSPVHAGETWALTFDTSSLTEKWEAFLMRAINTSDLNYQSRLISGQKFGWSVLTRAADGAPLGGCFSATMITPEKRDVVLVVSLSHVRILLPYSEEVLNEWHFSDLVAYALEPGGRVAFSVAPREGEGRRAFGKSRVMPTGFTFALQDDGHKHVYEALEDAWSRQKERSDEIFATLQKKKPYNLGVILSEEGIVGSGGVTAIEGGSEDGPAQMYTSPKQKRISMQFPSLMFRRQPSSGNVAGRSRARTVGQTSPPASAASPQGSPSPPPVAAGASTSSLTLSTPSGRPVSPLAKSADETTKSSNLSNIRVSKKGVETTPIVKRLSKSVESGKFE